MATSKETQKRKIIVYYALIVIPCIMLGFLAFRGIRNDQALLEKEQLGILQETATKIIDSTNQRLDSIETDFLRLTQSFSIPDQSVFHDSLLNRFVEREEAIAGIFYIHGNKMKLLNKGILFLPEDQNYSENKGLSGTYIKTMEPGWRFEFRENRYDKAVEFYRNLLPNIKDERFKAEILNAIARNLKKQDNFEGALETYAQILSNYPDQYVLNEIPLGIIALHETAKLHYRQGDTLKTLETMHLLMENLKDSRWKLSRSHFVNTISEIKKMMGNITSNNPEVIVWVNKNISVLESISRLENHTNRILNFIGRADISLLSAQSSSINQSVRFRYNSNGDDYLIAVIKQAEDTSGGIIYRQENILAGCIAPFIEAQTSDSEFEWEVTNVQGKILLCSDTLLNRDAAMSVTLSASLPAMTLKFYPHEKSLLTSFLQTGEGIFFYIFILIVLILGFGLFLILNTVNNEIKLSKLKSQFITTVSHEFKSPLASIRQMAEMLERDRVPTIERKKKYYQGILQQSERLSHLIENILNYSRMEDRRKIFQFQKTDIVPVIKDAVVAFENFMSTKGFQIHLMQNGEIPELCFDKEAMEQVLHNLLDNACKYSKDSRDIEVSLKRIDDDLFISIKDYGVGIKKEDREKIFSRFYRGSDELISKVKGSGIGLTIVKQIVDAHEGRIILKSTPGKGSTFQVVLPLKNEICEKY